MKREDLKMIIKLRSSWAVDKRRGNYNLPSGMKLSEYLAEVAWESLDLDSLGIMSNGSLAPITELNGLFELRPNFAKIESTTLREQEDRVRALVREMIY